MASTAISNTCSETEFAAHVDEISAAPDNCKQLLDLLSEEHPVYRQRGTNTTVRMRGWTLIALSRWPLPDAALVFVLEELDTGVDAYLVAAAARALRSYRLRSPAFAPFVMRALTNIRYRNEPVSFDEYGAFGTADDTSPVKELLLTLTWLGPNAANVLAEVKTLCSKRGGLTGKLLTDVKLALKAITQKKEQPDGLQTGDCCNLPADMGQMLFRTEGSRIDPAAIGETVFEDQDDERITFNEFFLGHPSIVVFFYTRCDNPLKCSLSVAKLARIQEMLVSAGMSEQVRTAAITYDPDFDLAGRIRAYGENRSVCLNEGNRMLRSVNGMTPITRHFKLGVNFIESLVNRHRLEVFVLDRRGRIAASFERLHWDEQEVVTQTAAILSETAAGSLDDKTVTSKRSALSGLSAPLFSVLVAFFPKCPICWAAYLSVLGVGGLIQVPYYPWLQPIFIIAMLLSLLSIWLRSRSTGRKGGFYMVAAGSAIILISRLGPGFESVALWGIVLMAAGSLLSTLPFAAGKYARLTG